METEAKLHSEFVAIEAAARDQQIKYLNWYNSSDGVMWTIEGFRGNKCSGIAYPDGRFTRLVQDPYAEVTRVAF